MSLKDVLMKLARDKTPILLSDGNQDWKADTLLETLSEPMLKRDAYFQQELYIAEINSGGYLGQVLYKVKQRT